MRKTLDYKDTFLNPRVAPPPGQLKPSARWAELTDSPLLMEACERALGEFVLRQVPDPGSPGAMAYRIEGAKAVLNVLLNLGEPDRPLVKPTERRLEAV